jgi:hypothetical protein
MLTTTNVLAFIGAWVVCKRAWKIAYAMFWPHETGSGGRFVGGVKWNEDD